MKKRKLDITYSNGIHIRLHRAKDSQNIQIIVYDKNNKAIINGPYLRPELALSNALEISNSKSLELYLQGPSPVMDTENNYYNLSDWM